MHRHQRLRLLPSGHAVIYTRLGLVFCLRIYLPSPGLLVCASTLSTGFCFRSALRVGGCFLLYFRYFSGLSETTLVLSSDMTRRPRVRVQTWCSSTPLASPSRSSTDGIGSVITCGRLLSTCPPARSRSSYALLVSIDAATRLWFVCLWPRTSSPRRVRLCPRPVVWSIRPVLAVSIPLASGSAVGFPNAVQMDGHLPPIIDGHDDVPAMYARRRGCFDHSIRLFFRLPEDGDFTCLGWYPDSQPC